MSAPGDQSARFVRWLEREVVADARGDREIEMLSRPADRLWLGRLAPEESAWKVGKGARAERLDPCSAGVTFRPRRWDWEIEVRLVVWTAEGEKDDRVWRKGEPIDIVVKPGTIAHDHPDLASFGRDDFATAFAAAGLADRSARIDVEIEHQPDGPIATVVVVNDTPEKTRAFDPNLYEVTLRVRAGAVEPILLDALPDSFRYDRRIDGYGVNGGLRYDGEWLETTDAVDADRHRPDYWDEDIGPRPDLSFATLAADPLPSLRALADGLKRWGEDHWSEHRLNQRTHDEGWSDEMAQEARAEAERFGEEVSRVRAGIDALTDESVLSAFRLTNRAFQHSGSRNGYNEWRPFQMGFLLSVLPSLIDEEDDRRRIVDTLWFATGGGKTETYLAAIVFTCLVDRLRGKAEGITAWSRFPLRMLSLQQTQRFADALAGAELARRGADLRGAPFALGFLVGGPPNGTPNRIRDDATDNATDTRTLAPERHRVLLHCPFCFSERLEMTFDRRTWRLQHRCPSDDCPWTEPGLPFFIVDEEIYRFLPSVLVGTLDKAASVALQAAQRGLYASPIARCSRDGHGFTYAPRSDSRHGCQVPGCQSTPAALGQDLSLFAPGLRVQDELHLLRDSLGAVDSHYETLLDHLQRRTMSPSAKLIASSATLSGYENQVRVLYDREGSVFPLPGPASGVSFWTKDSPELARRFVGLAPRGQTLEFANDRLAESLQRAVRRLQTEPWVVCQEAGIDPAHADGLLDDYGTHVCYGTKLADVDAAARSFETQPGVAPLNVKRLTGQTDLEEVRQVLDRLGHPEADFDERIHVVCASSMMSHGIDVDRFNVITLLGLPLATAEFIQTSARIGRRHPGLVFVLHRMGVERDSSVFRSFRPFVEQGDRFIEPIAITRRSRRVLEHTFPGLFSARVLGIHEAKRVRSERKNISIARELRAYAASEPILEDDEFAELCDALGISQNGEDPLAEELRTQLRLTFREINNPASQAFFLSELLPSPPMRSLREVETQIPVYSRRRQS